MTLEQVAARLNKSKRTVMRWVKQGRVPKPTVHIGRIVEFSDSVMERWFSRYRQRMGGKDVPARTRMAEGQRAPGQPQRGRDRDRAAGVPPRRTIRPGPRAEPDGADDDAE